MWMMIIWFRNAEVMHWPRHLEIPFRWELQPIPREVEKSPT
jgi:hypothetical protein